MNERKKYPELIDRFNAGELEGQELTRFLELLKENPSLQREVKLDKEISNLLKDEDLLDLRKKILSVQRKNPGNQKNLIYLIAASVLLLISVGLFIITQFPGRQKSLPVNVTKVDSAGSQEFKTRPPASSEKKEKNLLSSNYTPDPVLESLSGTMTRSGIFLLLHPKPAQVFGRDGEILFSWQAQPGKNIILRILNNKGKQVLEYNLNDKQKLKVSLKQLLPGLFYYKILEEDEILVVGKFTVR